MKELSIEEKAEAYDKALSVAQETYKAQPMYRDWLAKMFPQLKENEDERVRKWLIDTIKSVPNDSIEWDVIDKSDVLAWLEKQDNKSVNIDVESMVDSYKQRLKSQRGIENSSIINMCLIAFRHGVENVLDELNLKKHEKKDEQMLIDSYCQENCKGFKETGRCFADGGCKAKIEAGSTDKVEPKFKVGDWVVYNYPNTINLISKIIQIDKGIVDLKDINDSRFQTEIDELNCNYHLWTIEDAKIGDVLVTADTKLPFIYKGCLDTKHPDSPVAYCGIDTEGIFHSSNKFNHWWTEEKVYPATKEQRDTFFTKMREEGYEWSDKDRKLIKME